MSNLISTVLAASTVKSFGALLAVITVIGFVWYVASNVRAGKPEIASEIELAPNRATPVPDEVMEGPRLTRALSWAVVLLAICAVGLPLYWLAEPSRQEGAVENFQRVFVNRGDRLFAPTAEGGYNCAGCHGEGGVGGIAPPFTLTDADDAFVASVSWYAPALNTVLLRFSKEELTNILVYGRPGTPMPAWGVAGGGPLTTQQIEELVAYIESIQIPYEDARKEVEDGLRKQLGLTADEDIDYTDPAVGEALFNLGLSSDDKTGALASGAFSCARCHTKGASIQNGTEQPEGADLGEFKGFPDGSGAFGFSLRYPIVPRQFLTLPDLVDFIKKGSVANLLYGQRGQGSGRMPGFGDNPNTLEDQADGMFSQEMLEAVALYEANLHLDGEDGVLPDGETQAPFSYADATTTSTTSTTVEEEG